MRVRKSSHIDTDLVHEQHNGFDVLIVDCQEEGVAPHVVDAGGLHAAAAGFQQVVEHGHLPETRGVQEQAFLGIQLRSSRQAGTRVSRSLSAAFR